MPGASQIAEGSPMFQSIIISPFICIRVPTMCRSKIHNDAHQTSFTIVTTNPVPQALPLQVRLKSATHPSSQPRGSGAWYASFDTDGSLQRSPMIGPLASLGSPLKGDTQSPKTMEGNRVRDYQMGRDPLPIRYVRPRVGARSRWIFGFATFGWSLR